jgi:squalene-associated FAD-dependent desaturase
MNSPKRVVVMGAGLAGLSSSVVLSKFGYQVTLVERRPFPGGRTTSYPIRAIPTASSNPLETKTSLMDNSANPLPELVDNCQHILMRCCNNLLDFCSRLGVHGQIKFYDHYLYLDKKGRFIRLGGSRLPAPLHLLPSFLHFSPLTWLEKWAVMRAFLAMTRLEFRLPELDRMTMREWLLRQKQPANAIEYFWRPVLVGALNEDLEIASARYGIKIFIEGMLKRRDNFMMGVPLLPLQEFYSRPALKIIEDKGGKILQRNSVEKLEHDGKAILAALLKDGTRIEADYFISAVPPPALWELLPEALKAKDAFAPLRQFTFSPITSIHLWFDRPFTPHENLTLLGRRMQWIFVKGSKFFSPLPRGGFAISLLVSASRDLLPLTKNQIVSIALEDLHDSLPDSRNASLFQSAVFKEPYATFSCIAGGDAHRLNSKTSLENFFIAGDWTDTGWPATMEGAVRSGYRCAELVLDRDGDPHQILHSELPAEGWARWCLK